MGDENLLARVSTLEEQVRSIAEVKNKIDVLYNLLMEIKLDNAQTKSDFATKAECSLCRKELEQEMDKMVDGRRKLFWATVSSGLVLTVWLIQQLLHFSVKLG